MDELVDRYRSERTLYWQELDAYDSWVFYPRSEALLRTIVHLLYIYDINYAYMII